MSDPSARARGNRCVVAGEPGAEILISRSLIVARSIGL